MFWAKGFDSALPLLDPPPLNQPETRPRRARVGNPPLQLQDFPLGSGRPMTPRIHPPDYRLTDAVIPSSNLARPKAAHSRLDNTSCTLTRKGDLVTNFSRGFSKITFLI